MCGQLARAWGNERFGAVEPADEVCLAADQHEAGWERWELAPTLDPDTGLPRTFETAGFMILDLRTEGPRELATQSRYAALLVSLFHCSFFEPPGRLGRYRPAGRQIHDFHERHKALQAELRPTLGAPDSEIERNFRLLRAWDGLSHDLLLGSAPCTRARVPAAGGALVELAIDRRGDAHTFDPWPFAAGRVVVRTEGRLLEERFSDEERMRETLARAPWVDLSYELVPA
jgi:hypothetical protein